jgi:hypothetical protein
VARASKPEYGHGRGLGRTDPDLAVLDDEAARRLGRHRRRRQEEQIRRRFAGADHGRAEQVRCQSLEQASQLE